MQIFGKYPRICRPYGERHGRINAALIAALILFHPGFAAVNAADGLRILALGDSLTAGYGLAQAESFPARLTELLKAKGVRAEVVNAGVSGDTSSGALQRLDWLMDRPFDLAIVELGANDALRAVDPKLTERNLETIVEKLREKGTRVLLAGMKAPRNMGPEYARTFDRVFPDIAERHDLTFYPFFLEGVAANPELNQSDGMHPNAKGVAIIAERMLPLVLKALGKETK